jgi:hypothetical protein
LDYPSLWHAKIAESPDFRIARAAIAAFTAEKKW